MRSQCAKPLRLAGVGLMAGHRSAPMLHYLRAGWSGTPIALFKRVFRDYPPLWLRPDVIHFERGEAARGRTQLKRVLHFLVLTGVVALGLGVLRGSGSGQARARGHRAEGAS